MLINLKNEKSEAQLNSLILRRVPTRVKPALLCAHRQAPAPSPINAEPRGSGWGLGGPGCGCGTPCPSPELLPAEGSGVLGAGSRPLPADVPVRMRRSVPLAGCSPGDSGTADLSRPFVMWGFCCLALSLFIFFSPLPEPFSPGGTGRSHPRRSVFQVPGGTRTSHRRWSRIPPPGPAGSTGGLRGAPPSPSGPDPGTFSRQGRRGRRGEHGAGGRAQGPRGAPGVGSARPVGGSRPGGEGRAGESGVRAEWGSGGPAVG